jgi:GT2 family glycosyltransferase
MEIQTQASDVRPLVSVIIVVWNAQACVMECLESLDRFLGEVNAEIIAVDNSSTDGTPDLIEQRFPRVKLIRNPGNFGFARANNIGIAHSSGDFLAFVNSDVVFIENSLAPMLDFMANHPDIGMLGPQMLDPLGVTIQRSTMRFPTVWNTLSRALALDALFKSSNFFEGHLMLDFNHSVTTDVDVLAGWFWLVRRSALDKVGVLDEEFFMYGEDIDWCYRFHQANERVVFFADTKAIHIGGASSSVAPVRFSVEKQRANWQVFRKHFGFAKRFGLLLTEILHNATRAIGYGILYTVKRSDREQSLLKYQRSVACLGWLLRAGV